MNELLQQLLQALGLSDPADEAPLLEPIYASEPTLAPHHADILGSPFVTDTLAVLAGGMPARARSFDPTEDLVHAMTGAFITGFPHPDLAPAFDPTALGIAFNEQLGDPTKMGDAGRDIIPNWLRRAASNELRSTTAHEFGHLFDLRGIDPRMIELVKNSMTPGVPHHEIEAREGFAEAFATAMTLVEFPDAVHQMQLDETMPVIVELFQSLQESLNARQQP